jgi:hypothetical protein
MTTCGRHHYRQFLAFPHSSLAARTVTGRNNAAAHGWIGGGEIMPHGAIAEREAAASSIPIWELVSLVMPPIMTISFC